MSTGKRLAKRSIIGTRVCAPGEDGQFYSGVIHAVKTPGQIDAGHHADTRYSVRFDPCGTATHKAGSRVSREYKDCELIGPGFGTVLGCSLQQGQRVYLTYNGREICGAVTSHQTEIDEVCVTVSPPGSDGGAPMELKKRLEEVRLLESRKSLRLMDQDTDFARLADMAGDRKRASSNSIDVPAVQGSRKRRPSESGSGSGSGSGKDLMDECTAALVLMSLSCSPHSPQLNGYSWSEGHPPSPTSDAWSRGSTPSPPLSDGGNSTSSFWSQVATDEGIVCDQDFDDLPKKKKLHVDTGTRVVFQCTWPGCLVITTTCNAIEHHVRHTHLGPRKLSDDTELSDHEEEFYYTEVELGNHTSSPPTLSHRDMARPPHEDPEYLRQLRNGYGHTAGGIQRAGPINIPSSGHQMPWFSAAASSLGSPGKHLKLSPRSGPSPSLLSLSAPASHKLPGSPTRKHRGDTKKCRKVYGMEHRELWCTQCKWKKACTRFGE